VLDLSQAAARALGVDIAEDRFVDIRIIALPGDDRCRRMAAGRERPVIADAVRRDQALVPVSSERAERVEGPLRRRGGSSTRCARSG